MASPPEVRKSPSSTEPESPSQAHLDSVEGFTRAFPRAPQGCPAGGEAEAESDYDEIACAASTSSRPQNAPPAASIVSEAIPAISGRYDFTDDNNVQVVAAVPHTRKRRTRLSSMMESDTAGAKSRRVNHTQSATSRSRSRSQSVNPRFDLARSWSLTDMPSEIVDNVLSYLPAHHLAQVAATCSFMRRHALNDIHWKRCVQQHVPGQSMRNIGPFDSYRELYAAYDPLWFLPEYKIWFCDRDLMGKFIVVRYDQRRGCIEGYQLVAISKKDTTDLWAADPEVVIHTFEPAVKLHLDKPILRLNFCDKQDHSGTASSLSEKFRTRPGANRFADEMPMKLDERSNGIHCNFMLTRPLDAETADEKLDSEFPYESIWPPPTIPARHHVSGARSGQGLVDLSPHHRPQERSEVSDQTFRIRQWMEMGGSPAPVAGLSRQDGDWAGIMEALNRLTAITDNVGNGPVGLHLGDEIITFSTLDPILYTPTPTKIWRGIWVGDYSGHGCEFLLLNQPDDPPVSDEELGLVRRESETDTEWQKRQTEARVYRGRLEAIKLTGDPNVPRGEYTFIAEDLGPQGYVGSAVDPPFTGARMVRSKGHIAGTGFVGDKFIESQLILISPNKLAQCWVDFGHINFFERVDIDSFLSP